MALMYWKYTKFGEIMKKIFILAILMMLLFVNVCIQKSDGASHEKSSLVFFSRDITSENVVKLFKATQKNLPGKVAVQQSMGEPDGYLFIEPELSEKLVKQLDGIYINATGVSDNVSIRKMIAAKHGFMKAGYVDILDEHGQIELPVNGGKILSRNIVGSHIKSYDSLLVLTHFKGHAVSGIGGTMKNLSIGIASPDGKRLIHSGGKNSMTYTHLDQNRFLEANVEAAKSVIDYFKGNVVYINFLYKLAAASDYGAQHPQPVIPDIGILASTDPVALDKACTDMIYSAKGSKPLTDLFEEKNSFHSIEYASELGLGNLKYTLIELYNDIN